MAILSVKNVNKRASLSFVKFKRIFNIGLLPVAVTTLRGLWEGSDVYLNKILLIITVTLPGLLEVIGMLTAEEPLQINTDDVTSVDEEVVIVKVDFLPLIGAIGTWYLFNNEYYYWNGSAFVNAGGDRPTKPPVNP